MPDQETTRAGATINSDLWTSRRPTGKARMSKDIIETLEERLGRLYAKQRLGIEADYEARIFGQGINFFHIENWYSCHSVIRNTETDGVVLAWAQQHHARTDTTQPYRSGKSSISFRRIHHIAHQ